MNKKIIVAAVAAAVATPIVASADATMYGQVRVATQYAKRTSQINSAGDSVNRDSWGMADQVSRLGVKGDEDLGNGLKAIYQLEFGVDVGDGYGKSSFWSQRNSYVGLSGGFGTFLAGKHDTPYKISTGKLDFFADTAADADNPTNGTGFGSTNVYNAQGVGLFDSRRADGAIAYVSPSLAGFTFAGAVLQHTTDPFGGSNPPTGTPKATDFEGAYSLAGLYSNGPWFASLAYEHISLKALAGVPESANVPKDAKWRLGLGILDLNNFSAAFIYENHDVADRNLDGGKSKYKSWQLSAAYDFGNSRVKAMYGDFNGNADGTTNFGLTQLGENLSDFKTWAIGLQHNLSKRTDVQVLYRAKELKSYGGFKSAPNDDVFAVQLDHSF
jgi:predicted porin